MTARLDLLRRRLGQFGPSRHAVEPRADRSCAPLSSAQQRMWMHQELHPESSAYNVSIRLDLRGDLDEARLLAALHRVVERQALLRSTYGRDGTGMACQYIHDSLPPEVILVENRDPADLAREAAALPFDLSRGGPLRVHLLRLPANHWVMILTVHHIIWDGGCFGIFSTELSRAYQELDAPPLAFDYADFAANEVAAGAEGPPEKQALQLEAWRALLDPLPPMLSLPGVRSLSPELGEAAERCDRDMPARSADALRHLADYLAVTPFAVFISVYALLLRQWCGSGDVTIATMVSNRHHPAAGALLGNFGNTVLLRLRADLNDSFADLARRSQAVILDALGQGDIPFERLIEALEPPRAAGHGFFTDVLGLFLDRDIEGPELPGVDVCWDNVFNGASPFALTFQGFLTGGRLKVEVTHRSGLFDPDTINRMLDHLEIILTRAGAAPEQRCAQVAALPPAQIETLLAQSKGAEVPGACPLVLERWRAGVAADPEALAMIAGDWQISRGEADLLANRLAQELRATGLVAETPVAVALPRGLAAAVAPLAIWKAGGVYFPLNPEHPAERLAALLEAAGARHLISGPELALRAEVCLDPAAIWARVGGPDSDPGLHPHPLAAAHVSFTSGSTGRPKGVLTTHGGLAARTTWVAAHWPSRPAGATQGLRLCKSTPTAIDATAELCEAWSTGDALVLASDAEARDAGALAGMLARHGIVHLMAVPGLLSAMTEIRPEVLERADRVLSTGEPLLPRVARDMRARAPQLPLMNAYGCSETTGDVLAGEIRATDLEADALPVGTPLPGSCCYVLTPDLALAPQDVLGEIYIDSPQLVRGYLGQPGLTATRFVASPFVPGARLYRSGDLARRRSDGRLELSGRSDDQVNLRGHRVEPAETQAALLTLDTVAEAAVLPRSIRGRMELVAYVTGAAGADLDAAALKTELARHLPEPLVPARVEILSALPRLVGGKIDRQALAARDLHPEAVSVGRAPRGRLEETLAGILCTLLERDYVAADDNFFALGGDSMVALSLAARANAAGLPLAAAAVFQTPTLAELAATLTDTVVQAETPVAPTAPPRVGLAPIVHRIRLTDPESGALLGWAALRGEAETLALRAGVQQLLERYPQLSRPITRRGHLWRVQDRDTPPVARVLTSAETGLTELLAVAEAHIDLPKGQGIVGVVAPEQALLVAHAAVLDGQGLARAVAEIEAADPPEAAPLAVTEFSDAEWQELLTEAESCRWWQPPEPRSSVRVPQSLARRLAGVGRSAQEIIGHFATALCHLSQAQSCVFELESPTEDLGPLCVVPVCARAGTELRIGAAESYLRYCHTHRQGAAGPGVLLQPAGAIRGADPLPCGAAALYRICAGWQRGVSGEIILHLRGIDPQELHALMTLWGDLLMSRETADAH